LHLQDWKLTTKTSRLFNDTKTGHR